ncbi:TIGR03364 family FAD-dependent oxidoreductase [Corynebacterium sp.]|uniref:TIGR03364 family FAD-dependent oxidoreductase n=1 Tax=Corynebacterium sp. TaxID=1720 RepID=UPI0026DC40AA|nr:TIGR03364 family FAD-dependent oxidoreductase [Corynebacterium sp.]MDO5032715.1 TIGR03364 family FAD-dependent oxidoreductase [Corynebacterium sp.]
MKTDLLVVGGGILGLATAFEAHEKGLSVRVVDRAQRPVGSSIQNFGHACFTGQADSIWDTVLASRAGWLRAAEKAGLWVRPVGTYIPAVSEVEMQVLREFAEHRGTDQVRLLQPAEAAEALGNPDLDCAGGAHLPLDARVNPREAAPQLAAWLAQQGVTFNWGHEVKAVADGVVETNRGDFQAEHVVVCPNYWLTQLFPELADEHGVRVCTLAMALIERPSRVPAEVAMLTGTSLARYDGFAAMPGVDSLRAELQERESQLVDCVANLMATGIEGGLFLGDSHAYDYSPEPFVDQDIAELLIARGSAYFGIEKPRVLQRWQGRYADSRSTNLVLERPDERTTVAVVTSGIGMTMSFGVADLILNGGTSAGWSS